MNEWNVAWLGRPAHSALSTDSVWRVHLLLPASVRLQHQRSRGPQACVRLRGSTPDDTVAVGPAAAAAAAETAVAAAAGADASRRVAALLARRHGMNTTRTHACCLTCRSSSNTDTCTNPLAIMYVKKLFIYLSRLRHSVINTTNARHDGPTDRRTDQTKQSQPINERTSGAERQRPSRQ